MINPVLNIINIQYCNSVSQPIVESVPETTWSPAEAEFHNFHLGREIAKMPPNIPLAPSYWLMRSKSPRHFAFEEGWYERVLIIVGRNAIYWHAMGHGGEDRPECLSGTIVIERRFRSDKDILEQVENILDLIQTFQIERNIGYNLGFWL
ncbi:unnamed protein product [Hermetia illucens]|uniref:Uncharacterized protein n=1 Tax=Hermetia illucens TaxID=343691 RepID=A0A7R8UQG0_HERIL|nr:unnamed protein product [Hermetia illucens]